MTLTTGSTLVGNYTREFDLLTDRLQRQKFVSAGGSALFELEYAYQQGSYLHGITDRHAGAASDGFDATAIFSYDPRSRLLSRTLAADASGTARFFGYDELGNLILRDGASAGAASNQLYSGPRPHQLTQSTLLNKTYTHDDSGNVTRRGNQYYAYDSENRLGCVGTSASPCSSVVNSFAYDLDGNRIWEARSLSDVSIFFGSDFEFIPASPGKSRFHVVANGRVIATRNIDSTALRTELGGWLPFVDWSARELSPAVIALALSGLLLAALAAGRRQPWAEHPIRTAIAYGVLLSLVVPPVAARAGGAPPAISNRFTFSDHLGSPMLSINTAAEVVFRRVLEPFGRVIVETNPGETDPDLYTGKRRERISGLVDFGARWYDPEVGRFTALDPIAGILEDPQTHNGYSYVNNNPSNNIDPDGRCAWWGCLDLILYAAIAAAGSYAAATSGNSGSSGQGQAGVTFSFGGAANPREQGTADREQRTRRDPLSVLPEALRWRNHSIAKQAMRSHVADRITR
jgi:RHS repeat-associated protein